MGKQEAVEQEVLRYTQTPFSLHQIWLTGRCFVATVPEDFSLDL